MKWQDVQKFAEENGLSIYRPYCGYHKLAQITTTDGQPVSWTANKAKLAYQSIASIVHQRQLATLTDDQAIAAAETAKSFF